VSHLYPWGGEYVIGNPESCVAAVTLSEYIRLPKEEIAIHGHMKTENLGIEKVLANVLSNPNIRFLIVCDTILAIHKHGIDGNNKVVGAKGAVPFIENLTQGAVERFRQQVEILNMIGECDPGKIMVMARECAAKNPGSFGEPFIAIKIEGQKKKADVSGMLALHSSLRVDPYFETTELEG
jgi:tetrahydromethanopterin S-methyltransferase subunit A